MPSKQQERSKGIPRSAGRRGDKYKGFYTGNRLAEKKLRRVLKHNSEGEARSYADKHGLQKFFQKLLGEQTHTKSLLKKLTKVTARTHTATS